MQPAVTVRDSGRFGQVACMESHTVTQSCRRNAQRNSLKGELRCAGREVGTQLPCQQGEGIEGAVCSHSVQLAD